MTVLTQADNRCYFGVSGMGKSALANMHSRAFRRVIICDWNTESQHEHGATCVTADPLEFSEAVRAKRFRVVWRRSEAWDSRAAPEDWYDFATKAAKHLGDTLVVWDEAENGMPWGRLTDAARDAWNSGRHHGNRFFVISRSPFAISRHITRNLTRACIFAIQETNDVRWLKAFIGGDAAKLVPTLQRFHAVDWHQGGQWALKKSFFP